MTIKTKAMNTCEIGKKAEHIWEYLYTNGECSIAELKKKLKINTKELYLALGWISRNDKIAFYEKEGVPFVFLLYM